MHTSLLSLLGLALLGTLHAQDTIPVQTDFQQDKLTGRWFSIGLASNSNWFKEKKHLMKMCTTVISETADGNLEVTSTYPKGDQCEKRNSLYTRTEQPGRFSYTSPRWGSKHDIRVVETNYEEYALVATQISKSTGPSTMVLLYSRTKELSPEHLERFTQFSREQGLADDEILILPRTGEHSQGARLGTDPRAAAGRSLKSATSWWLPHPLRAQGPPAPQQPSHPGFTPTPVPPPLKPV
uniref:Prostaglandin-H2 D-isomerase n=1 Tax=Strigops habroptila TaxID=2489341 RepID=A0A672UCY9_STRHB